MAAQLLEPGFFTDTRTVVVVSPHPDDDVLGAGALMDFLAREMGLELHTVFVTTGSNQAQRKLRESEARASSKFLGAKPHFLGLSSEELKERKDHCRFVLGECFQELEPGLILQPASDLHPTHQMVRDLVLGFLSSEGAGKLPKALDYEFWSPLRSPELVFSFGDLGMRRKLEALSCHDSQLKRADYAGAVSSLNRWRGLLSPELVEGFGSSQGATRHQSFAEAFSVSKAQAPAPSPAAQPILEKEMPVPDISVFGDIFLDTITSPMDFSEEEGTRVVSTHEKPGGNAANFSLAAARLGSKVLFMSALGRDQEGERLKGFLGKQPGLHFVHNRGNKATPRTFALVYRDGRRQFLSDFGTNTSLHTRDFKLAPLFRARHFHRAGFFWLEAMGTEDNRRLLEQAREAGLETSIDTGTPPEGRLERFEEIRPLLPLVDIYFGNQEEICGLAGCLELEKAARAVLELGVGAVVVHGGEKGAGVFTRSQEHWARAIPIVVENPVGSGDIFNAAFVVKRLQGASLQDGLDFANLAGAYHVAHVHDPYPTPQELERWRVSLQRSEAQG